MSEPRGYARLTKRGIVLNRKKVKSPLDMIEVAAELYGLEVPKKKGKP